jgi:hypothetical protein
MTNKGTIGLVRNLLHDELRFLDHPDLKYEARPNLERVAGFVATDKYVEINNVLDSKIRTQDLIAHVVHAVLELVALWRREGPAHAISPTGSINVWDEDTVEAIRGAIKAFRLSDCHWLRELPLDAAANKRHRGGQQREHRLLDVVARLPPKVKDEVLDAPKKIITKTVSLIAAKPKLFYPESCGSVHLALLNHLQMLGPRLFSKTYLGFTTVDGIPIYFSSLTDGFQDQYKTVENLLATNYLLLDFFSKNGRKSICRSFDQMNCDKVGQTTVNTTKKETLHLASWYCGHEELLALINEIPHALRPDGDCLDDLRGLLASGGKTIVTHYGLKRNSH